MRLLNRSMSSLKSICACWKRQYCGLLQIISGRTTYGNLKKMTKTSVIILNWNGEELLKQFLPTVITHTGRDCCRVIVADNGSTDGSVAFLQNHFPDVELI